MCFGFFFPSCFLILRFVFNRDFLDGLFDVVNFGVWFVETDQGFKETNKMASFLNFFPLHTAFMSP